MRNLISKMSGGCGVEPGPLFSTLVLIVITTTLKKFLVDVNILKREVACVRK